MKNLEFKARIKEAESLESIFTQHGATFSDVLNQRDTYFNVLRGRLKLREIDGKRSELIFYERDESSSSGMESIYDIYPVVDPKLKDFLAEALGVKVVVEKKRRLLKLRNARIHLDEVKGLGSFLEFEVVSADGGQGKGDDEADAALLELLKGYAAPFVVREINESYSDLVIRDKPCQG